MIFQSFFPRNPVTKRHIQQKILPTHPLHLFRIIQDVDQYSTFLPLCQSSKIIRRSHDGRCFDGKLRIGKPPLFEEEYISRVTVIPEEWTIQAKSIKSRRFDSLTSQWKLGEIRMNNCTGDQGNEDNDTGSDTGEVIHCHVDFQVEMTVSDPFIVSILDQVLEQVASRQVDAFAKRCQELPIPYDLIEAAKYYR